MDLQDVKQMLQNKISSLETRRNILLSAGEMDAGLENEIAETKATLESI